MYKIKKMVNNTHSDQIITFTYEIYLYSQYTLFIETDNFTYEH